MKIKCLGLSSLERTMGRERSRIRQLREGDANTAYFHLIARGRKRKNYIPALAVDGHTITDHVGTELAIHAHFSNIFGTAHSSGSSITFSSLGI
jgi:hypothetical protein